MAIKYDNCKNCHSLCIHAGKDREFVCINGVSCKITMEKPLDTKIYGGKGRMKDLADIQKMRYDRGCVVYNTNNYKYGIVLNGKCGEDKDPCSQVLELTRSGGVIVHTPPNRALIPTGRFVDVAKMIKHAIGEELKHDE